jgi:A/G-specific adenine glycosylase
VKIPQPGEIRKRILSWYDTARRDLPWRTTGEESPDPYRVWLAEIMLQQTRVETVIPYYRRWLDLFPSLEVLAAAETGEVLRAWEGLGYYSRARNLHRAVREVVERYGSRLPDTAAGLRELPGVGRYTAGAIASIAFDREEPVVDGNVRRVLARWADEAAPGDAWLWAVAGELVRGPRPGDLNQGLMELGATVCTPRNPRCEVCPAAGWCAARAGGTQHARPARRRRGPLPRESHGVAVVERGGAVLLARRRESGLLGGFWELPTAMMSSDERAEACAERAVRERLGMEVVAFEDLGALTHVFTHLRATYHAVRCRWLAGEPRPRGYEAAEWVPRESLERYPVSVAQRRLLARAAC